MKEKFLFGLIILQTIACSQDEKKIVLFSTESFAYTMETGWEINGTVRAKGFEQKESGNRYSAKLSYSIDLETQDGRLLEGIDSGLVDKTANEKIDELEINIQFQLDSTYKAGGYKIIFNVTDDLSGKKQRYRVIAS